MSEVTILENYSIETIIKAVMQVLTQGNAQEPLNSEKEEPEEYVSRNTVKKYRTINDYPDMMRVKDVKDYLRIGENKAYDLLNHPKCPRIRMGSTILIRKERLVEFIAELENGGAEL